MNDELIIGLRYTLVAGAMLSTLTTNPDLQRCIALPIDRVRFWYSRLRERFLAPTAKGTGKRFWEIDMTEFEP